MTEEKAVRVPAEMLERAAALVGPVKAATLGAARWNQTAIVRLALDWGLAWIEQCAESGAALAPPTLEIPTKGAKK